MTIGDVDAMGLRRAAAAVVLAAAGAITATPGTAAAVVSEPTDAAVVVHRLQDSGFRVILVKTGDEPLARCRATSVRPGRDVTETVPAGGGDTTQKVVYTTVIVTVDC